MPTWSSSRGLLSLLILCGAAGPAFADGALGVYDSKALSFVIILVMASPILLVAGLVFLLMRSLKSDKARVVEQQRMQQQAMQQQHPPREQSYQEERGPQ